MMKHEQNEKGMKSVGMEDLLDALLAEDAPVSGIQVRVKKVGGDGRTKDTPIKEGRKEQEPVAKQSEKPVAEEESAPTAVPPINIRIKNLHIHMDERMTSNFGSAISPDGVSGDDGCDHSRGSCTHGCSSCAHGNNHCAQTPDFCSTEDGEDDNATDREGVVAHICRRTGLKEKIVITVLAAMIVYLDTVVDDEEDKA